MRCRIATFTAIVVLTCSCPGWSQDAPKDSTSVEADDEATKRLYLHEAEKRVGLLVEAFEEKATKLVEFETAITNAEKVISQAIVAWDDLQKKVQLETNEITNNLIVPRSVDERPSLSARDSLVQGLLDAIAHLKSEKPYRLSSDETSSLEKPDNPLAVGSVTDDADRLRWLEQQLILAEQLTKGATPSVPSNAKARRSKSLAFIKEHLGVEKMVDEDRPPILDALKTLQPAESK